MTTIDLGEVSPDEWDPGGLAVPPERRRRALFLLVLVIAVLIGAAGAVPPAHAVQPAALMDLADVDEVDVAGNIAVGVLPDTGEIVAVSLDTGRLRWRHESEFNGRPNVQIDSGRVILDAGAGSPRLVSIVDIATGRLVDREDGSVVAPAIGGVQAVRRVDETGSTVRALGRPGGWVSAWPPDAVPVPVYAQGRRVPAVVVMESGGGVRRLDLVTGEWTELGRMDLGDIPLGLFDGRLQVRQDRRGAGYIALYDTVGGHLTQLWRDRISGGDPPRLIPCGVYLCGGTFGSTTAYDMRDGHAVWNAEHFRITATVDGPRGDLLLAGVITDAQRHSQEAILDPATGKLVAALGPWRLGGVLSGRALVYRAGIAGRAWLGELDLRSAHADVRTTLHLPVPAQRCDFGDRWAVCLTGVADQPPFAVPLPQP